MDVQRYLDRIAYTGSTVPTADTLRALHYAHLVAVPFENLDIAAGRKIILDEDALIHKIVERRRGGFCYELNGAYAVLLRALGFQVTLLSARVGRSAGGVGRAKGGEGPEFDHLALRVDLDESWLADVGFGESFLHPLLMETGREHTDPAGKFRLTQFQPAQSDDPQKKEDSPKEDRLQLEKLGTNGRWKGQYSFSLVPCKLEDFAGMCHYHQTSLESYFTQGTVCSRATLDGRITLSGMKWIVTRNGHREERELADEDERKTVLRQYFGITDVSGLKSMARGE
jgi:N-hydroxyarylamine O-acetyltransferase